MTTEENIKQAAEVVAKWPQWKIDNMKNVFSEPDINQWHGLSGNDPSEDLKIAEGQGEQS